MSSKNSHRKITAIVLAGGRSSRMGRDKALLNIDGKTMLARTCQVSLRVAQSVYVVVHSLAQYHEAWRGYGNYGNIDSPQSNLSNQRLTMVVDRYLEGALVGFSEGIAAIAEPCEWILLLACDLPNLDGDVLEAWAQNLEELPPQAIAYLPRYSSPDNCKRWEPLCGFYRWQCLDSLSEFTNSGGRSFQKWLKIQSPSQVIEIENIPRGMLLNCNTPEDFHALVPR